MKKGDVVIGSYISPRTGKRVWSVSEFRRYLDIVGKIAPCFDQLKGGFQTKTEASAWVKEYKSKLKNEAL